MSISAPPQVLLSPRIFLYGPPGSGKSTLGKRLAEQLDLPFHDLDELVVTQAGLSIPEIFASQGETAFRDLESQVLQRLVATQFGVIALGGGALLSPSNRALVEQSGTALLLTASLEVLLARLQDGNDAQAEGSSPEARPLLAGDLEGKLSGLLERRASHYASFPLHQDTTHCSLDHSCQQAQVLLGRFRVHGMGQPYDVVVQPAGLELLGPALAERGLEGPLALVSDRHVGKWYALRVANSLRQAGYTVHTSLFPSGERYKTLRQVERMWQDFISVGLERGSTVLALGGGVVGDLAGFAAAAYLRGVPWVCLPTSLLAMVDASLGGKTGADLPQGKNLIGAFHSPRLVLADPLVLSSLPAAEWRNGLAEVVKHGIIGDPELFEMTLTVSRRQPAQVTELVRRSMAVKVSIIEQDPYEKGLRAALNLGHTVGHAVEFVSGYRLQHGEAVAIGMVAEARLSESLGLAQPGLADKIATSLRTLRLPTEIPAELNRAAILQTMGVDKKRLGGVVRFALPVRIGEVQVGVQIDNLEERLWSAS
jgi:3-dehydroquinate synthase